MREQQMENERLALEKQAKDQLEQLMVPTETKKEADKETTLNKRFETETKPKSKKYRHRFQRASVDLLFGTGAS